MTSKRNPNKRNLGPVIALTGAGIALAAVIAGFIAVGGPGDARERRLDGMTMARVSQTLGIAQCALHATGAVPATFEDAVKTRAKFPDSQTTPPVCGDTQPPTPRVTTADQPTIPGEITYRTTGGAGVSVCANFRRGQTANDQRLAGFYAMDGVYPQLDEARAAGIHCFEVELVLPG